MKKLTIIVGAIIYVVTPVDLLPDFIPAGFVDDLSILAWAANNAAIELNRYKCTKEIEENESEGVSWFVECGGKPLYRTKQGWKKGFTSFTDV